MPINKQQVAINIQLNDIDIPSYNTRYHKQRFTVILKRQQDESDECSGLKF